MKLAQQLGITMANRARSTANGTSVSPFWNTLEQMQSSPFLEHISPAFPQKKVFLSWEIQQYEQLFRVAVVIFFEQTPK